MSAAPSSIPTFDDLRTPRGDGETLVVPGPPEMARLARDRDASWRAAGDARLLGTTRCEWRRLTRLAVVGTDDLPVIVTGHQPELFHAGVWAKNVVAQRLAEALGGAAVHLVVDNDAPRATTLAVPTVEDGRWTVEHIPFTSAPAGRSFEEFPRLTAAEIGEMTVAVRRAMGARYERSQMPAFLAELERGAERSGDWVDQVTAARRAIEHRFGVVLLERRVSSSWWNPLVADLALRAAEFTACYNDALARYRADNRIRHDHRPMPDLAVQGDRYEVPLWAHRTGERRRRAFVQRESGAIVLSTDEEVVTRWSVDVLRSAATLDGLPRIPVSWRVRPRALMLTLWARLLLADLFIHGIGGAKYDRITDRLISCYYGGPPPPMACVSATLRLDIPREDRAAEFLRRGQHRLRDLVWNPWRHVAADGMTMDLVQKRGALVAESGRLRLQQPGDRAARLRCFDEIRRLDAAIVERHPEALRAARESVAQAAQDHHDAAVTGDRTYFFGLHDDTGLRRLIGALPPVEAFAEGRRAAWARGTEHGRRS
jgi:hypothetical protein